MSLSSVLGIFFLLLRDWHCWQKTKAKHQNRIIHSDREERAMKRASSLANWSASILAGAEEVKGWYVRVGAWV